MALLGGFGWGEGRPLLWYQPQTLLSVGLLGDKINYQLIQFFWF